MQGDSDTLEEMQEKAREMVWAGYTPLEEIEDDLAEYFDLSDSAPERAALAPLVEEEIIEHQRQQATWGDDTDCDRLDRAFAWLQSVGVVARQNFACCPSCGRGEIRGEMETAQRHGLTVRGYTFFHMQETEGAVRGEGMHLHYGPLDQKADDADYEVIGRMVVAALRDAGLKAVWNGSGQQTIRVELCWRKRRVASGPEA